MGRLEKSVINQIKSLSIDMIHNNDNQYYQNALLSAPIFYALYGENLSFKRSVPNWINRDRVIIASKNSANLYSTLFLSGFDLSIEDLKNYGKFAAKLDINAKLNDSIGVDCNVGSHHGVGNAVGIAIAERYFESLISKLKPKSKLIDFHTYLICDVANILNGNAMEALSLAGTQKLNKLIVICENVYQNHDASKIISEDLEARFEALDFNVIRIKNSINTICETIDTAKKSKKPTFIMLDSINKKISLPQVLDESSYQNLKMELTQFKQAFVIDERVKEQFINNIDNRLNKPYQKWLIEYENCRSLNNSKLNEIIDLLEQDILKVEFDESLFKVNDNYFESLALSNEKIMNILASKNAFFFGVGLNDVMENKAFLSKLPYCSFDSPLGRNLNLGNRPGALGDIVSGLIMMNLKAFGNIDASMVLDGISGIRNGVVMNLPVTYIVSNDSFISKNNGIYSPIEEINDLRLIPNLFVIRPADINEVIGAWDFVIKNRWPVAILLNNKKMQCYKNTNSKYVKYGAYMIKRENARLDGIIISSGSDIEMAMNVASDLLQEGIDLRVVSMPCMELFMRQNPKYEEQLLPKSVKTFVIESSDPLIWNRFATNKECIFGINKSISNGSEEELLKDLYLDKETIKRRIKENL